MDFDYIYGYHVSSIEGGEKIKENGLNMSYQDNRPDAAYFFLDKEDAIRNADNLGLGHGGSDYSIVTIKIPRNEALNIRDDGLYNGTFSNSYSAARLLKKIPSAWITQMDKINGIRKSIDVEVSKAGDPSLSVAITRVVDWLRENDDKKAIDPANENSKQNPIVINNFPDPLKDTIQKYTNEVKADMLQNRTDMEAEMKDVEDVLRALAQTQQALAENAMKPLIVNLPEQPAPVINVSAPVINTPAPQVTIQEAEKAPINLTIKRDRNGKITGIEEQ